MISSRSSLRCLALAVTLLAPLVARAQQPIHYKSTELSIGMYLVQAEVAATEAEREQGLMFREKMPANAGMVFLFGAPAGVCMWMKNTLLPLSVAFIDGTGTIVNIEDMKPQTLESHCARKPIVYALEMNQGWFAHKKIGPGTHVNGLPAPR